MSRAVQACVCFRGRSGLSTGSHGGSSPSGEGPLECGSEIQRPWSDLSDDDCFRGHPRGRTQYDWVPVLGQGDSGLFLSELGRLTEGYGRASRPPRWSPHGLSTCGGVVEWLGFLPRFPELVGSDSLGEPEFSTACPHRVCPLSGALRRLLRRCFPGRGVAENSQGAFGVKRKRRCVCAFVTQS